MNETIKQKIKDEFRRRTNRDPSPNEEVNMLGDQGLILGVVIAELQQVSSQYESLKTDVATLKIKVK